MLAAAATVWLMFSVWLIAPHAPLPRAAVRLAGILLTAEIVALLLWSYGTATCDGHACPALAQAAGVAARTDIPVLAAAFLALLVLRLARRGLAQPPASTTSYPAARNSATTTSRWSP